MIVVFVVDTSPSMRDPVKGGLTKIDMAKMFVEKTVRGLKKRVAEHNGALMNADPRYQESMRNIGLGWVGKDEILLLATGRQHMDHPATATCGAGGRLLVGFGGDPEGVAGEGGSMEAAAGQVHHGVDAFQRELKRLKATDWKPGNSSSGSNNSGKFPEDGGGANGLNIALSAGLSLLSRYRLRFKVTENFGMGRLPSSAMLNPSGGTAANALQPACLILLTDGMCLLTPPHLGGGSLELRSSALLGEFYKEPFRWDQRIFCIGVGGKEGQSSMQYLHPQLRALSDVTGGSHMMLRSSASISADLILKLMAPPRPRDLLLSDPLLHLPTESQEPLVGSSGTFVNGGPVCCFQAFERDFDTGHAPSKSRATLLYVPHQTGPQSLAEKSSGAVGSQEMEIFQPPIWPIPETYFPGRKLETLPPRSAQPPLLFSFYPSRLGSKSFEASTVIKMLHRLDQIGKANKEMIQRIGPVAQSRVLKRDTYICEWISEEGKSATGPSVPQGMEYFPVLVQGGGRTNLGEGDGGNVLSIGILHVPRGTSTLSSSLSSGALVSSLTLLPPEPQILLPLLIRSADAEHRALKKAIVTDSNDAPVPINQKQAASVSRSVPLDENWRSEFRAYLFRLPPYYINATKRCLRNVLPASAHSLLNIESGDGALAMQCYSKTCHQKIRNAEQIAKAANERLERQEAELRKRGMPTLDLSAARGDASQQQSIKGGNANIPENRTVVTPVIGYGQYDPRSPVESYLAALRNMPAPRRTAPKAKVDRPLLDGTHKRNAMDALGDLPAKCLMAYYESRRRWIFGGSGLATRGLHVEGVPNDGSNVQHCGAKRNKLQESLLSLAGVGVSQMNETTTAKMGDYRERLLWSRAPIVGSGANDSTGVSGTTSQNGAPVWSVEDEAMPIAFFDPKSGAFTDSVEARVRSRLMVNFGNPFKDKRADSLIPDAFLKQRPQRGDMDEDVGPMTPPSSPPHDSFSADEGEGEAIFAGIPHSRKSPRRSPSRTDEYEDEMPPLAKKPKVEQEQSSMNPPPPPPPKAKDEKPGVPGHRPPPPPRRRQATAAPPPPPKAPPSKAPLARNSSTSRVKPPPPGTTGDQPNKPQPSTTVAQKRAPPPNVPSSGSPSAGSCPPPSSQSPATAKAPPPVPPQVKRQSLPQVQQQTNIALDMQTPDKKPDVDLPQGWMCVWSKSQKRWYFFNTKTNKSVWQWPPPPT